MRDEESKRFRSTDEKYDEQVDENDIHAANGKNRGRGSSRKRHDSGSPEEDIIDGFAISSYSSIEALEVCCVVFVA